MTEATFGNPSGRVPWHVWVVGVLAVLWNGAGAYTIVAEQTGTYPNMERAEAAYYAAQQAWFVIVTDIGLFTAVAAGLALLIRSRLAVALFAISLAAIVASNGYELATGTSRIGENAAAAFVTVLIWVLAVLELWYAAAMKKRGILR